MKSKHRDDEGPKDHGPISIDNNHYDKDVYTTSLFNVLDERRAFLV